MNVTCSLDPAGTPSCAGGWLRKRLLRSCEGGALVELAVVVSLLTVIIVGATEFAMLAYDSIEVTDAAHAGAAYGAQSTANAGASAIITSVAAASANDISALTTAPLVLYSCSSTPSTLVQKSSSLSCTTGDSVLTYIQVTTTATITMPIHLAGLGSYTLNGYDIERVQ